MCYCDYALDKAYPLPSIYVYLQLNNDPDVRPVVTRNRVKTEGEQKCSPFSCNNMTDCDIVYGDVHSLFIRIIDKPFSED